MVVAVLALVFLVWIKHGLAHLSVGALRAVDEAEHLFGERHGCLADVVEDSCLLCPGILHAPLLGAATQGSVGGVDGLLELIALRVQSRVAPCSILAAPEVLVDVHKLFAQHGEIGVILRHFHVDEHKGARKRERERERVIG